MHVVSTEIAILRHGFYDLGATIPRHRHELATIVYGVGGPCIEHGAREGTMKRRLTFHPVGYEHSLEYRGPTHVLAIEIHSDPPGSDKRWTWPSRSIPLPATFYDQIWRVMVAVAHGDTEATNTAMSDLFGMVDVFQRQALSERMMQVIDNVHLHWRDVPSVRELASRFRVSPQYLCRTFKRHTGVTLQQYGLLLRIDYARGLLWGSEMPISHVAAETGFSDQSHLTRVLVAHSRRTPRRLRQTAHGINLDPVFTRA